MSGNVYEGTESERSDGHTRFAILRGGSYFDPHANPDTSSIWYNDGGPRPCDHHAKFLLMYPGLDRCSTIGFRCVKDVALEGPGVKGVTAFRHLSAKISRPADDQLSRNGIPGSAASSSSIFLGSFWFSQRHGDTERSSEIAVNRPSDAILH